MALDPRKRQKKIERRNAKRRAKHRAIAHKDAGGLVRRLEAAAHAPILHCRTCDVLTEQGMGHVLVSRELPSGAVAWVAFLVDMYCLGVKDVTWNVSSRAQYDWRVHSGLFRDYKIVNLQPAHARKLVEGAVAYARDLGFAPPKDYSAAKLIFGDIDAAACSEPMVYGKDGKPFFIAGPNDGPARCRQIISVLTARCGLDGFHYLMPVTANELGDLANARHIGFDDVGFDDVDEV